jgi:hypothetical protein
MKASLVAYDFRELHKKSELKIVKYGYVKGFPKELAIQIWSLKILGVNKVKKPPCLSLDYWSEFLECLANV